MRKQWVVWSVGVIIFVVTLGVFNWFITSKSPQVKQKGWEDDIPPAVLVERIMANARSTRRVYTIQACSFKDYSRAQKELKRAQGLGFPAYLGEVDLGKDGVGSRIYIGEFTTKGEIDGLISRVKNIYKNSFVRIIDKKE